MHALVIQVRGLKRDYPLKRGPYIFPNIYLYKYFFAVKNKNTHFQQKLTDLRHTDDQTGFTEAREVGLDESGQLGLPVVIQFMLSSLYDLLVESEVLFLFLVGYQIQCPALVGY